MKVEKLTLGVYQTNCYVVYQEETSECIIIDPSSQADIIFDLIEKLNLKPKAIFCTHGHSDHIMAIDDLQSKWNLPVYCHKLDVPEEEYQIEFGVKTPTLKAFSNLVFIEDGTQLNIAGIVLKVLHTPGHTRGSVIFYNDKLMFSGDTLFRDSIGRTDFEGGNIVDMVTSLEKIYKLDLEDCIVYPGHNSETNLKRERQVNPYLKRFY